MLLGSSANRALLTPLKLNAQILGVMAAIFPFDSYTAETQAKTDFLFILHRKYQLPGVGVVGGNSIYAFKKIRTVPTHFVVVGDLAIVSIPDINIKFWPDVKTLTKSVYASGYGVVLFDGWEYYLKDVSFVQVWDDNTQNPFFDLCGDGKEKIGYVMFSGIIFSKRLSQGNIRAKR